MNNHTITVRQWNRCWNENSGVTAGTGDRQASLAIRDQINDKFGITWNDVDWDPSTNTIDVTVQNPNKFLLFLLQYSE